MSEKKFNLSQTGAQVQEILNSAKSTDQVLTEIQEAMEDLPDGQAVSAQVALNTAAIQELDANKASKTEVVFDISAYHATGGVLAEYADLTAALGTNGANIPDALRKGGMSVKFVQSSDNNYVQFRCIPDEFTTDVTKWAICDDTILIDNPEFLDVITDKNGIIAIAVKRNGDIFYGAGVPTQIKEYIQFKIAELGLDGYDDIVSFLGNLIEGDKTLKELLDKKMDGEYIYNPEFLDVITDKNGIIIESISTTEKTLHIPLNCKEVNTEKINLPAQGLDSLRSDLIETGKHILWVGTSIPAGSPYPYHSCEANGYHCINNSQGSQSLAIREENPRCLMRTVAEFKSAFTCTGEAGKIELTEAEYKTALDKTYERAVLPYISGTSLVITDGTTNTTNGIINPDKVKVSAIIIDHSYNDYVSINSLMENPNTIDWTSRDRTNFVGAYNALIDAIQVINPFLKIVIGGYFENTWINSGSNHCGIQKLLAEHLFLELFDVWNYSQISTQIVKGTQNYIEDFNATWSTHYTVPAAQKDLEGNIMAHNVYCPDNIHPHSDYTGRSDKRLDAIYTKLMRSIV